MQRRIILFLGVVLIAGGLVGVSLTWTGSVDAQAWAGSVPMTTGASEDEMADPQTRQTHSTMHALMEQMMGIGAVERMHAMMPGAEEMMAACAGGMGHMMSDMSMDGMQDGSE